MITHSLSEYIDGKGHLIGRCGAIVDRADAGQPNQIVDCMTCLVHEARHTANQNGDIIRGRVVSINPDGTAVIDIVPSRMRPWR